MSLWAEGNLSPLLSRQVSERRRDLPQAPSWASRDGRVPVSALPTASTWGPVSFRARVQPPPAASSRRQEGRPDLRAGGGVTPRRTAPPGGGPRSRARQGALGCPGSGSAGPRRGPLSPPSRHWGAARPRAAPARRAPAPLRPRRLPLRAQGVSRGRARGVATRPPSRPRARPGGGGRGAAGPCWAGGASSPWRRSAAGIRLLRTWPGVVWCLESLAPTDGSRTPLQGARHQTPGGGMAS